MANEFSKLNFLDICFVSDVYEIDMCILTSNPVTYLTLSILIIYSYKFLGGFSMDDPTICKKVTPIIFNHFAIKTTTW